MKGGLKPNTSTSTSSLVMPEVQSVMAEGGSAIAAKLSNGSWMTPELMQRIAKEPRLIAGMQQPRYIEALGELQKNPGAAKAKYARDPGLTEFLTCFAGILGEHFSKLGEAEEAKKQQTRGAEKGGAAAAEPPSSTAKIGLTPVSSTRSVAGQQADEEVKLALSNPRVVELLGDPGVREMMKECSEVPGALRKHMGIPKSREKLLELEKLGLVKFS